MGAGREMAGLCLLAWWPVPCCQPVRFPLTLGPVLSLRIPAPPLELN